MTKTMILKLKFVLFLLLFTVLQLHTNAQTGTSLWAGASIEKNIGKKISLNVNLQARMPNNISYVQTYFAELGLGYKLLKNTELSIFYRQIERRKAEDKDFKTRQRYYANLAHDFKINKKIKIENRLRYQKQFKDNDGEFEFDADYLRYKLGVSYSNKSKLTPEVSADVFYQINGVVDELRPKFSLNYKLNKAHSLEASLFKNVGLAGNVSSGLIFGTNYKFKF